MQSCSYITTASTELEPLINKFNIPYTILFSILSSITTRPPGSTEDSKMHIYNPNNSCPSCEEAETTFYSFPELSSYETEERDCVRCCEVDGTTDIMQMDMDASPASSEMDVDGGDESDESNDGDGGDIPFHTPHSYTTLQQLQKQKRKRKRNTFTPTNLSSNSDPSPTTSSMHSHTPRTIKPRGFFRREPLSSAVARLREKWKENVSARAETALWSGLGLGDQFGYGFGGGFGFEDVIQAGIGLETGSVGAGRGPGAGGTKRFYRGREIGLGHGLPDWVPY